MACGHRGFEGRRAGGHPSAIELPPGAGDERGGLQVPELLGGHREPGGTLGERAFHGRQGRVRVRGRVRGDGTRDGRTRSPGRAAPVLYPQAAHVYVLFIRSPMEGRDTYLCPATWSLTSENNPSTTLGE